MTQEIKNYQNNSNKIPDNNTTFNASNWRLNIQQQQQTTTTT